MNILTVENSVYDLNAVPDQIDDLRYCVFDAGESDNMDYFFLPLIFLESFHSPSICLKIGDFNLQMPMDWSIVITDEDMAGLELIPLASLNNRGFVAPVFNPMRNSIPLISEIQITNIYQDVKWYVPKLKNGHILVVPLENKPEPKCALFVKELTKVKNLEFGDLL
jgi:hypothetical protein